MAHKIIITRADETLKAVEDRIAAGVPVAAVLSIEHPGAVRGAAPRLAESGHPQLPQKILVFWDAEQPVQQGPDLAQVRDGVDFALAHLQKGDVIIHCHAGKSRSVAVALGVLALANPDTAEKELLEMLLVIRPQAAPNIIVVEMVDALAGRQGKLTQAVLDHPVLDAQRRAAEASRQRMLLERPELLAKLHPEKFPGGAKPPRPPSP